MASMNIKSDDGSDTLVAASGDYDRSPTIYLNDDQVEALGIKNPVAGTLYVLKVIAKASSVTTRQEESSEVASEGNKTDVTLTLTLTDITVESGGKSMAERMYGG
jgi:hypothetical protein